MRGSAKRVGTFTDTGLADGHALSRRSLLYGGSVVLGGLALGCRSGESEPATQSADAERSGAALMPDPTYVETNGIRMAVYEKGEGLPVVLCHGFPELAYSWRHQIAALSEAGYRAIAPDQRGYGLTDRPEEIAAYALPELCADLVGLLDALEIERAVFCGHDWGGGVVWMMPRLHPDRVAGVIGVNTPASDPRPEMQPDSRPEPLIVRTERYYATTFQEPGVADQALARDVRRTFDLVLRTGGIWNVDEFKKLPEDSPERRMDLLTMLEGESFPGEPLLSDEEIAFFVETYERTGFTGGLNWYRAAGQVASDYSSAQWDIEVPCLYVGAEHDVILRPESANGMEKFIDDFEKVVIEDCGHWTQQEKPEELDRILVDWLARKFPGGETTA